VPETRDGMLGWRWVARERVVVWGDWMRYIAEA